MTKINFSNRQRKIKLPDNTKQLVTKAVEAAISVEGISFDTEVNVTFVSDAMIKNINNEFRSINKSTDVLSFPLFDGEKFDINPENGCALLGDIIISIEHALNQAELYGHGTDREIAYLAIHSMFHLLGYDHLDEGEDKKIMRAKEEKALGLIGLANIQQEIPKTYSAFIAIVGRPNVGKSSIINKILGQKVAIVSDKPQTTRTRIMGVFTDAEKQFVFVDTPGFHKPRNVLGENMMKSVGSGMNDVDAVMLVVEAVSKFNFNQDNLPAAELELISEIKRRRQRAILVINKIDLLEDKEKLFEIISAYTKLYDFDAVIPVSALKDDGIQIIIDEASAYLKESVHYFGDDDVTDQSEKVMVAEMIREKLLRTLDKEIPHGIAIDIERFYERDTADGQPILDVEATIYCEKASHKGIIIGKGGAMLKKVGSLSRKDIEDFYGIKASLKLWVKVKEDWRNRQGLIHSFGLD